MKYIVSLLLLMFTHVLCVNGQTPIYNQEFGMTIWKYRIFTWNLPPNGGSVQTEKTFVLKGDTSINGKVYSLLYADTTDNDTVKLNSLKHVGYIYKDSGKIWRLDTSMIKKRIFDFTVTQGDTLPWLLQSCVLSGIGSYIRSSATYPMYIVNPGLALSHYSYTEEFGHIEGQGILTDDFQYIPIGIHRVFELVTFNSHVMKTGYKPDVIDSSGAGTLSINNTPEQNSVQLYPNPANDKVSVSIDRNTSNVLLIKLHSICGNTVKEFHFTNNDNNIDVSHLSQGLYIYTISEDNKIIATGKLGIQ